VVEVTVLSAHIFFWNLILMLYFKQFWYTATRNLSHHQKLLILKEGELVLYIMVSTLADSELPSFNL